MTVRPRSLLHGGRVLAEAVLVDPELIGEAQARTRCLRAACRGARIESLAGGYLVRWERPQAVFAERCPGLPLVRVGSSLVAAPLTAKESEQLAREAPALALVRDGRVQPHAGGDSIDLSAWLDVSALTIEPTESLGLPPRIVAPTLADPTATQDARAVFGAKIPAETPELKEVLAALKQRQEQREQARASAVGPGSFGLGGGESPGLLGRLAQWLSRQLGEPQRALPSNGRATGDGSAAPMTAHDPPEPSRLAQWLRKLVMTSPLADAYGRRQADYIRRTMELFQRGAWDDALRHAIPFGGDGGSSGPSMWLPKPRESLQLGGSHPGPVSSLGFSSDLYSHFKEMYRRAAQSLERLGRIEEAAYVLFELLGENDAGIALLERYEKWGLAARMAEQRKMPPGLVVRLWFLAGRPDRAVLVARRTKAFADAITRLESRHSEHAMHLRILWADWLADSGDYAAAIDAIWPSEKARHLAIAWIDRAIAFGGTTGARMLVRKLELLGHAEVARAEVRDVVLALIAADDPDAPQRRADVLQWLGALSAPLPPLAAELTRVLTRHVLADRGGRPAPLASGRALPDPLLDYEVGRLPFVGTSPEQEPRSGTFARHERGLLPIRDAIELSNRRLLVALGEAGIRLVDADGNTLRSYEHPADRLIPNPSTNRVIAATQRGPTWSLRQLDLTTGRATRWCDARLNHLVDHFDGGRWFVADDDSIAMVDTMAPELRALWRVGNLPGTVRALAASDRTLSAIISDAAHVECWMYDLGDYGPVLRTRTPCPPAVGQAGVVALAPTGSHSASRSTRGSTVIDTVEGKLPSSNTVPRIGSVTRLHGERFAWIETDEDSTRLCTLAGATPSRDILVLEGAMALQVRAEESRAIVVDDLGRLIVLDNRDRVVRWLLLR